MPIDTTQYNTIMRQYDAIRTAHREELEERRTRIYQRIPELKKLEDEVASESVKTAKLRIAGNDEAATRYKLHMAELAEKKARLLKENGLTESDLSITYDCPICLDTGTVNGEYCKCFRKAVTDLLYRDYAPNAVLSEENFENFSFEWYSDTISDDSLGKSERDYAKDAYQATLNLTRHMGEADNNLLLYGNTGVGKTFLTHCASQEVLRQGYSVLYFSAAECFNLLADAAFRRSANAVSQADMIERCDLLIIDDLGTEYTNNFTASQLFQLLNERIKHGRATIISTNLSLSELSGKYTERVFSRIASSYTIRKLVGRDIRIRRKTERGS